MWLVDVYNYDKEIKLIFIFWFDIVMQFFYIKKYIADIVEVEKDSFKKADKIIDIQGKYLVPGFIDSHLHIESRQGNNLWV